MENKYKVYGKYDGKKFKEKIEANSKKQAKIKAGFKLGFGGNDLGEFMKSRKVKVRRVRY